MVWSQYVWEANTGFDPDASDNDDSHEDTPPVSYTHLTLPTKDSV